MNISKPPGTSTIPSPDELASRIGALSDVVKQQAETAEALCRLPDETIAAFRETEFQKLLLPKRFGGWEHSFEPLVDFSTTLARHCASSAWSLGLYIVHTWLVGQFPGETQDDIWGENPGALVAGSYAPAGPALPVDGGYRLSGRFSFASGAPAADWILCGAMLPLGENEALIPGFTIVPRSDCTIDWDSWEPVGQAGTGSQDVLLDDVFVPAHRILTFAEAANGDPPGAAVNANPLYRMSLLSCVPFSLALPPVGAALGALERFVDENTGRDTRGAVVAGGSQISAFQTIQKRVGEATAILDSCLLIARRDIREAHEQVAAQGKLSFDLRMRNRRSHAFLAEQSKRAMGLIMDAAGGRHIQRSHPTQRAWRDVQAINAHISLNFDAVMSMYGQHLFGRPLVGQV